MKSLRRFLRRLANSAIFSWKEKRWQEEIEGHLRLQTADNLRAGLSAAEARRQAVLKFGPIEAIREAYQTERGMFLETLLQDIRFAMRILRKSAGFAIIAIFTIALGIGATTTVFSLLDAVLLKPFPYPQSERIVFPWQAAPPQLSLGYDKGPWSRVEFLFFSQQSKTFQDLAAFKSDSFNLTGSGDPLRLDGLRASAAFFRVLQVFPSLGRAFSNDEDLPGHEHEVILSDALWRERFGADPNVLDSTLDLNGAPYTVIGVMPRGFAFPRANEMPASFTFSPESQLWVPLALNRGPRIPAEPSELAVMGRLRPGISVVDAQAELHILESRFEAEYRITAFPHVVTSFARQIVGDVRQPLLLIFAAVGVVLLIACSNLAGLLLTRALGRKSELALRSALGARSWRLMRQLLTEGLVLASIGGLFGVVLADVALRFVKAFGPSNIPRLAEVSLNPNAVAFAAGITALTGLLFGLAPATSAIKSNIVDPLKTGRQWSGMTSVRQSCRHVLLVGQVALAFVLVVAAGLLVRSFYRLLAVDTGFQSARVLSFELSLPPSKYVDQPHIVLFYDEMLRRMKDLPGVQAAAITETVPMSGATESTSLRIPGPSESAAKDIPVANYTVVSAGYFSAVGTPILRGRAFSDSDRRDSVPVTIINEAMARKFWPEQNPLGKQVGPRSTLYPLATVVGVVADVKRLSLREAPPPEMYVPYTQKVWPSLLTMNVMLRTLQQPESIGKSAQVTIDSIDPDLPVAKVRTLASVVSDSLVRPRFSIFVLGSFGGLALLLATIGMYGSTSYSLAQRTQEIGVRMALGARPGNVLQMLLGEGARVAFVGIAIGVAVSLATTRLMRNFLYGIGAADPLTFGGVSLVLLAVMLLACYIPARRAIRIDPMIALRDA